MTRIGDHHPDLKGRPANVPITVVLFPEGGAEETGWDVALWHNGTHSREWEQLDLNETDGLIEVLNDSHPNPITSSFEANTPHHEQPPLTFTNTLFNWTDRSNCFNFTVKYRRKGEADWIWVKDGPDELGDGELIFKRPSTPTALTTPLGYYIHGISPGCRIETHVPDSSTASLWTISIPIPASSSQEPFFEQFVVGLPTSFTRYFALVRQSNFWLCPRHGFSKLDLDEEAILLSFLRNDGYHFVVLAVSTDGVVMTVKSDDAGNIIALGRNDEMTPKDGLLICAIGDTIEEGIEMVMARTKALISQGAATKPCSDKGYPLKGGIKAESLTQDDFHNGLIYCTWNSLGPELTYSSFMAALHDLNASDIYPSTIIIDDGWQSVVPYGSTIFQHRLASIQASSKSFPDSLKMLVSEIKKEFPWVKNIGVWHGVFGYWGGIEPDSEIGKKYKLRSIDMKKGEGIWVIDSVDVQRFYDDFYSFLVDCGVNAVKLDTQGLLDDIKNSADRRDLIPAYQAAIHASATKHFGNKVISCMAQYPSNIFSPEILLSSNPSSTTHRIAMRNSDDFWPNQPDSHPWHIHTNSHTSLLTTHLDGITPDWDMFQTTSMKPAPSPSESQNPDFSTYHAAARCLSGGLISITDTPNHHNNNLLSTIIAPPLSSLPGSKTPGITLPVRPGKTAYAYAGDKEHRILKISTTTICSGTPVLGLFNPYPSKPISEILSLSDFPEIDPAKEYIIRSFASSKITQALSVDSSPSTKILITLPPAGWDILTAHPVLSTQQPPSSPSSPLLQTTPLGHTTLLLPSSSLLTTTLHPPPNQTPLLSLHTTLLPLHGTFTLCLLSPQANIPFDPQICSIVVNGTDLSDCSARIRFDSEVGRGRGAYVVDVDMGAAVEEMRGRGVGIEGEEEGGNGGGNGGGRKGVMVEVGVWMDGMMPAR
ncbi:raffinose synthase Sip1 protein [Rutstroemia sp. NJR-2017a BVV2]|nr:raffinose synthase Sip1 protein [Rutstroemia sp. NJR-2017a BVV2]PQE19728.1 raffinose synthase Sip1 protein [Rutstroemia sp. NJR-2017a BVV2]